MLLRFLGIIWPSSGPPLDEVPLICTLWPEVVVQDLRAVRLICVFVYFIARSHSSARFNSWQYSGQCVACWPSVLEICKHLLLFPRLSDSTADVLFLGRSVRETTPNTTKHVTCHVICHVTTPLLPSPISGRERCRKIVRGLGVTAPLSVANAAPFLARLLYLYGCWIIIKFDPLGFTTLPPFWREILLCSKKISHTSRRVTPNSVSPSPYKW